MKIVGTIDDDKASCLIDRLLAFEEQDPEQPVQILINSTGGMLSPAFAMVDVMASLSCPVYTTALGRCESAATLILAAGEPGHRVVHPSTKSVKEVSAYHLMTKRKQPTCRMLLWKLKQWPTKSRSLTSSWST